MTDEAQAAEATEVPFDLPDFEGQKPVGVQTSISGTGQRITRPLHIGQRVILVVEAEVSGVNHKESGGLKRIQTLAVKDLYEAEGKDGAKLLSGMKLRAKKSEDARSGKLAIPTIDEQAAGVEVTVDENGTALTPEEVAAARGDDAAGDLIDEGPVPVVLYFSDGSRSLWPDDYVNTDYKTDPYAGDFMPNPNRDNKTEDLRVMKVEDVETGETIEEWTQEKEDAALFEAEKAAEAEEAAAPKPKKKAAAKKKKPPKVIVDEITPAEEAEPELPEGDE